MSDFRNLQVLNNHPVHIIDNSKKMSPSAFVPFCQFGRNISNMGLNHDDFGIPVCNSFQTKILRNQLCFEIDLEEFNKEERNKVENLEAGFVFIIDFNEDRQVMIKEKKVFKKNTLVDKIVKADDSENILILLNTIGIAYTQ